LKSEVFAMIKVTATKLRNSLFDYLDKAAKGETIIIERSKKEVARLIPTRQANWRDKMTIKTQIRVSSKELMTPLEDIWEEHV